MKKHKCYISEEEIGINLETLEKDYFCPICQKLVKTVKLLKR